MRANPKRACDRCGAMFRARKPTSRYCSRACYLAVVQPPARACGHCGDPIPQTGWSYEAKFCSRACFHASDAATCNWKGGRRIRHDGYVDVWRPGHPMVRSDGYVLEHRLVVAEAIGRPLRDEEVVHHRGTNRADNRLENLLLFADQSEHMREHYGPIDQSSRARAKRARRAKTPST